MQHGEKEKQRQVYKESLVDADEQRKQLETLVKNKKQFERLLNQCIATGQMLIQLLAEDEHAGEERYHFDTRRPSRAELSGQVDNLVRQLLCLLPPEEHHQLFTYLQIVLPAVGYASKISFAKTMKSFLRMK